MLGRVDVNRELHEVGDRLHEHTALSESAVDAQPLHGLAEVGSDELTELRDLRGNPLEHGENEVLRSGRQRHPGKGGPRIRPPPGCRKAGERRDAQHACGILGRDGVEFRGGPDEPEVLDPVHRRRRRVHLPIEAVRQLAPRTPGDGCRKPGGRPLGRLAGVREQERAGAERALRLSRLEAVLGEERGLLVDDEPADRDATSERGRLADDLVAGDDPRHPLVGEPEVVEQLLIPLSRVEVGEERSARGGDVADELTGQVVHHPGVGGRDDARCRHVPPQPGHLRGGEVRIDDEAGLRRDPLLHSIEFRADAFRPAVLPDNRVRKGLPRLGVPGQHRLALVGERDDVDGNPGLGDGLSAGVQYGIQHLVGVLLDTPAIEVGGADGELGNAEHPALTIDDYGLRPGSALINREYRGHFLWDSPAASASASSSASIECWSGIARPLAPPRLTKRYARYSAPMASMMMT